jgi:Protein of unknown function (DUF2917)
VYSSDGEEPAMRNSNTKTSPRIEMALARGSVLGIGVPGRVAIACVAGVLWVTAPETGDVVLVAGDATTIDNHGRIVIEALQTAEFDIETDGKLVEELRSFEIGRKGSRVANDN